MMLRTLLASLLLAAVAAEPQTDCGRPETIFGRAGSRIVNGDDAEEGAFPWQLALEENADQIIGGPEWEVRCGAALISENWAVTAAHCVHEAEGPMELRIVAGLWYVNDRTTAQEIDITQGDITIHPDYDSVADNLPDDIALIHLPVPADTSNPNIHAICLPPHEGFSFVHNPHCFITGWGFTESAGPLPPPLPSNPAEILQVASTDVIGHPNCALWWNTLELLPTQQCVKDQVDFLFQSSGVCGADLGGPLSCVWNTRFLLAGVGSFTDAGCTNQMPEIFTSVSNYLPWIYEVSGVEPWQP